LDYDLRLRLNQLKYLLKAVINFQLDLNIHSGSMTKDDAILLMKIRGFQTQAEAERKWDSIILNPGEAVLAYVGHQEILDMEKAYKSLKGDSFSKKEFLEKQLWSPSSSSIEEKDTGVATEPGGFNSYRGSDRRENFFKEETLSLENCTDNLLLISF